MLWLHLSNVRTHDLWMVRIMPSNDIATDTAAELAAARIARAVSVSGALAEFADPTWPAGHEHSRECIAILRALPFIDWGSDPRNPDEVRHNRRAHARGRRRASGRFA